jgi:hypothetical protein
MGNHYVAKKGVAGFLQTGSPDGAKNVASYNPLLAIPSKLTDLFR